MQKPVGERYSGIDFLEPCDAFIGVDLFQKHVFMNLRDSHHVANLRRKAETADACGFQFRHVFQKSLTCMGQGLHTVQCKEWLAVQRLDRQAVRLLAADELAIVLDMPLGAGMGTARGDGKRHAPEAEDLEGDVRRTLDDLAD